MCGKCRITGQAVKFFSCLTSQQLFGELFSLTVAAFWPVCELGFLGSGVHNNAGVCVEPQEPLRPYELFWSPHLSSPVSTLGPDGLFAAFGELHHRGSPG